MKYKCDMLKKSKGEMNEMLKFLLIMPILFLTEIVDPEIVADPTTIEQIFIQLEQYWYIVLGVLTGSIALPTGIIMALKHFFQNRLLKQTAKQSEESLTVNILLLETIFTLVDEIEMSEASLKKFVPMKAKFNRIKSVMVETERDVKNVIKNAKEIKNIVVEVQDVAKTIKSFTR